MKNSDHRKMSLIFRLEYYGANKRDVWVTGVMVQYFVSWSQNKEVMVRISFSTSHFFLPFSKS
jgi:hypothetical protein